MPRGVKRSNDEKVKSVAMFELGYTYSQIEKEMNIPADTVKGWVAEYKMSHTKLPEEVLAQMQNDLVKAARRQFQIMKHRYGNWALALSEHVFEIAETTAQRLKDELNKGNAAINHQLLYRLSGTLHYMIGDATLLAGMPTQRQVVVDETLETVSDKLPPMELEEKATKLIDLAESMKRRARQLQEEEGAS